MTATPNHLTAIAAVADAMTPAVQTAKANALQAEVNARLAGWANSDATQAALDADIAHDTAAITTGQATTTTLQAQSTAKAQSLTTLQQQVAALQAQVAAGGPPATAADVEERDQIVALASQLGVAIP